MTNPLQVLLVEDNPGDAFLIQQMLAYTNTTTVQLTHVDHLSNAVEQLKARSQHQPIDIILLDLLLPDSQGLITLQTIHQTFSDCPIVVLTGLDDESLAIQAVKKGAQDYLVKGQVTADLLSRSLSYAIERKNIEQTIQQQKGELEQTNQTLQERTEQLEMANAELDAFNYAVSHDLKNPLTVLGGGVELLEMFYAEGLDERGTSCLQQLRMTINRMTHLVEDLLQLSQMDGGELRIQMVNLSAIANEISLQLQQQAPDRHVDIKIAPDLTIHGDFDLLWVALENLLGNAWKYTQRQQHPVIEFGELPFNALSPTVQEKLFSSTIHCTASPKTAFEPTPSLSTYFVKDNGVGFDMDNAHNIFKPFQRLHSQTDFEGTGIGLATVKRIIHRHNGKICVTSTVNQGATFFFTLSSVPMTNTP